MVLVVRRSPRSREPAHPGEGASEHARGPRHPERRPDPLGRAARRRAGPALPARARRHLAGLLRGRRHPPAARRAALAAAGPARLRPQRPADGLRLHPGGARGRGRGGRRGRRDGPGRGDRPQHGRGGRDRPRPAAPAPGRTAAPGGRQPGPGRPRPAPPRQQRHRGLRRGGVPGRRPGRSRRAGRAVLVVHHAAGRPGGAAPQRPLPRPGDRTDHARAAARPRPPAHLPPPGGGRRAGGCRDPPRGGRTGGRGAGLRAQHHARQPGRLRGRAARALGQG